MKNGVMRGINITVTAVAAVSAGDGVLIGDGLFGYAIGDAAIGEDVVLVTEGVIDGKKLLADVVAVGKVLNWNNTTKELQLATSDLDGVGIAVEAGTGSDQTIAVKLTP